MGNNASVLHRTMPRMVVSFHRALPGLSRYHARRSLSTSRLNVLEYVVNINVKDK